MKRIMLVVGSLRKNSFNRTLAAAIKAELADKAEVTELDFSDLPLMNQDIEWPTPDAVQRVRDEFGAADGIWFVSPEYNGSYPGHVKNLIDWMSRPTVQGDFTSPTAIGGACVTVSGAAGRSGSRTMQAKLIELLQGVRARVMAEPTTGVVLPGEAFMTDQFEPSAGDLGAIAEQAAAFIAFIEA